MSDLSDLHVKKKVFSLLKRERKKKAPGVCWSTSKVPQQQGRGRKKDCFSWEGNLPVVWARWRGGGGGGRELRKVAVWKEEGLGQKKEEEEEALATFLSPPSSSSPLFIAFSSSTTRTGRHKRGRRKSKWILCPTWLDLCTNSEAVLPKKWCLSHPVIPTTKSGCSAFFFFLCRGFLDFFFPRPVTVWSERFRKPCSVLWKNVGTLSSFKSPFKRFSAAFSCLCLPYDSSQLHFLPQKKWRERFFLVIHPHPIPSHSSSSWNEESKISLRMREERRRKEKKSCPEDRPSFQTFLFSSPALQLKWRLKVVALPCNGQYYPNHQRWYAKMGAQSEYVHVAYTFFAHLAPTCMLGRWLTTKFLHRSSGGSLLRVCCWLGHNWGSKKKLFFLSFLSGYQTNELENKKAEGSCPMPDGWMEKGEEKGFCPSSSDKSITAFCCFCFLLSPFSLFLSCMWHLSYPLLSIPFCVHVYLGMQVLQVLQPNHQWWHARWKLSQNMNMYMSDTHIFARLTPICMLSRCLLTKFLHRSSVESLLQVLCWLGR